MPTGENIKKIRLEKGIEKSRLAIALNISEQKIDQIESKSFEVSVSELLRIASALNTDIATLIYGKEKSEKKCTVTKSNSRIRIERKKLYQYESLAPYYKHKHMEPLIIEIYQQDKEKLETSSHTGEEFHYILQGKASINVDGVENILEQGDSIYFDSSLPHTLNSLSESTKILASIYDNQNTIQLAKSRHMRDLIQAAKLLKDRNLAVTCPDEYTLHAVEKAIQESIISKAFLVGDIKKLTLNEIYRQNYEIIQIDSEQEDYFIEASKKTVELIKNNTCHMIMKGNVNTAIIIKAILDKRQGISCQKRLSLVSIFEIPGIDRLVFLTDPGINPGLFIDDGLQNATDIINNAIELARSLGVIRPKVALLDANEVASEKIPSTMYEQELSNLSWDNADVYGPLSYDLALYEDSVKKKKIKENAVAGKADVLVVPSIDGGNFLYKSWSMTMHAETANVVIGAKVPIIITSRFDSEFTKFLTICASSVYSQYILTKNA